MNLIRWFWVVIAFGSLSYGLELPPGTVKPTEVVVIGDVLKQGPYKLPAGATLLDAIFAAGGFTNSASRYIVIMNEKKEMTEYKLHFDEKSEMVSFSIRGESDNKRFLPVVKNADVIHIKEDWFMPYPWQPWSRAKAIKWKAEQAGADQPATKPADKPPVKDQPSTPTPKVVPR